MLLRRGARQSTIFWQLICMMFGWCDHHCICFNIDILCIFILAFPIFNTLRPGGLVICFPTVPNLSHLPSSILITLLYFLVEFVSNSAVVLFIYLFGFSKNLSGLPMTLMYLSSVDLVRVTGDKTPSSFIVSKTDTKLSFTLSIGVEMDQLFSDKLVDSGAFFTNYGILIRIL